MPLPNFLIIGQLKAGTTSLYHYLNQHPAIFMTSLKETRFFSFDETNPKHLKGVPNVFPITTIEEYIALFDEATTEQAIGEASPDYFNSPIAPARIKENLPNVRLIASLRNPVDRIYSSYLMSVRGGNEKRPFLQAFRENVEEQEWGLKTSFACENLKRYLSFFDSSQLKIVLFDDIKSNSTNVSKDLFRFLEVDEDYSVDTKTVYNKGGVPKNKLFQNTYQLFAGDRRVRERIKAWVPPSVVGFAKNLYRRNLAKAPPLEDHARKEVLEFYREDILGLQEIIKRDLSLWLR